MYFKMNYSSTERKPRDGTELKLSSGRRARVQGHSFGQGRIHTGLQGGKVIWVSSLLTAFLNFGLTWEQERTRSRLLSDPRYACTYICMCISYQEFLSWPYFTFGREEG
jgi:hypothetical protein